ILSDPGHEQAPVQAHLGTIMTVLPLQIQGASGHVHSRRALPSGDGLSPPSRLGSAVADSQGRNKMTRDDACTNPTNRPLLLLVSGRAFRNQAKSASTIPSWNTRQ